MLVVGAVYCEDCLHGFTVRFRAVASFRAASRVKFSAAVHDVQGTACEWFTFQLDHFCTLWKTMRMVHVPALCCFISYSCMELFGISLFTRFRQCLSSSTMVGGVRAVAEKASVYVVPFDGRWKRLSMI